MKTVSYVDILVIMIAWGKGKVISADLSQFSLSGPGSSEHALDGLDDAWGVLRCSDGIGMLVKPNVAGLEKLGELAAIFEAIKTARPADEDVLYRDLCRRCLLPCRRPGCPGLRHQRRRWPGP